MQNLIKNGEVIDDDWRILEKSSGLDALNTSMKTSVIVPLNFWKGSKNKDGNIVLYKEQKAPNGTDGFSRLTFYDINKIGYKWIGEWVDKSEKVTFPFWKIVCVKKEN